MKFNKNFAYFRFAEYGVEMSGDLAFIWLKKDNRYTIATDSAL